MRENTGILPGLSHQPLYDALFALLSHFLPRWRNNFKFKSIWGLHVTVLLPVLLNGNQCRSARHVKSRSRTTRFRFRVHYNKRRVHIPAMTKKRVHSCIQFRTRGTYL